jgi:DNA polymerase III epsilon subunit family exonuclease
MCRVQLALDSLDRLVELVEERGGRVLATEAAARLFSLQRGPDGLARALLEPLVAEDARLALRGRFVALADHEPEALEEASFVVFDLETTGLATASARICEIGAVRVERLELTATFETLVAPGVPLPAPVGRLTGLSDAELRRAPRVATALRRFSVFTGDSVLVAHNARFDLAFVNRELERLDGRRLSAPVIDTVTLARNLLRGRVQRTSLASLAFFFGTSASPCHRALPDAEATAEVLLALIGLAQERGARTVADLEELAAPRPRRVHGKRGLVRAAPTRPGVYLFRDEHDQVLYVGKARDLQARLRTYFQSGRQRPAVEAALEALERVEWHLHGSELSAALEELELIRELRPPANSRTPQPERYVYLRRQGESVVVTRLPSEYGPIRRRAHADRAARALSGCTAEEFALLLEGAPLPRLRQKMRDAADCLHYEQARRLRDRIASLERVTAHLRRLEELRALEVCLVAPALEEGWREAFFVAGGRVACRRRLPPGAGARLELQAGMAAARAVAAEGVSRAPEHLDELTVVGTFLERPPPELRVVPFDEHMPLRSAA